jgi:undecaprenyl-diphosphatase
VDSLIAVVAQDAIYLVAALAVVAWLLSPRHHKVGFAVQGVLALAVAFALIKAASAVYVDPRPFVVDPALHPLFAHPADNGFPSDHTAVASAVSFVVLAHRRSIGVVMLALSVLIGAARVAAHVHHWLDIGAGLLVGVVAAAVAVGVVRALQTLRTR